MRKKPPALHLISFCIAMIAMPIDMAGGAVLEQTQLTFGRWAITNNAAQHSITVNPNGSYNASSAALVMLSPPVPGVYLVTELPPFHTVGSVSVVVNSNMTGSGPGFVLDNFTTQIPPSDGAGTTTLTLGARARTTGTTAGYGDGRYVGELNIEINL